MRAWSWVPLLLVAGLGAGCATDSPEGVEEASAAAAVPVPERDLTLQAAAVPPVEVASPVELDRPVPPAREGRRGSPPLPAPSTSELARPGGSRDSAGLADAGLVHAAPEAIAAEAEPALAERFPAGRPAAPEEEPGEEMAGAGRELAPGKTVTLIPVSNGPSIEADDGGAWVPSESRRGVVRGGGHCPRPRGGVRGAGLAGRFPVAFPARRLR